MPSPRMLWLYNHMVARAQEVRLFQESGFEVVVAMDELPASQAETGYHDETHPLYPPWRLNLTLPTGLAERLRRIRIYETNGKPPPEDRALLNREVDLIYLGGHPDVTAGVLEWFEGTVLYRVMGYVDSEAQEQVYRRLDEIAEKAGPRFVLSLGYANLAAPDRACARGALVFNGWVDKDRVADSWAAEDSLPRAATAISYAHFHPFFRAQYQTFRSAITSYDFVVLGKNDRRTGSLNDARVLGVLPARELYNQLARSRVYVDAGQCPSHLIWPPVEAAHMGVPVLFTRQSGLVGPSHCAGYDDRALRDAGMFDDFAAINDFLQRSSGDFTRLRAIAASQARMWNEDVFSRGRAKGVLSKFAGDVATGPAKGPASRILAPPDTAREADSARAFSNRQGANGFRCGYADRKGVFRDMPTFLSEHNIWVAPEGSAALGPHHAHPTRDATPVLRWTAQRSGLACITGGARAQGAFTGALTLTVTCGGERILSLPLTTEHWERFALEIPLRSNANVDVAVALNGPSSDGAKTWLGVNVWMGT